MGISNIYFVYFFHIFFSLVSINLWKKKTFRLRELMVKWENESNVHSVCFNRLRKKVFDLELPLSSLTHAMFYTFTSNNNIYNYFCLFCSPFEAWKEIEDRRWKSGMFHPYHYNKDIYNGEHFPEIRKSGSTWSRFCHTPTLFKTNYMSTHNSYSYGI